MQILYSLTINDFNFRVHFNKNGKSSYFLTGTRMQMKQYKEERRNGKDHGSSRCFPKSFQMDRRHSRRWKPVSFLPFSFLYLAAPSRIRGKVAFDRSCQLVPEEEPSSSSSSSSTCSSSSLSKKRGEMLTRRFVTFLIFFFFSTFFIFWSFRTIWWTFLLRAKSFFQEFSILIILYIFIYSRLYSIFWK